MNKTIAVLLAAALTGSAGAALAHGRGGFHGGGHVPVAAHAGLVVGHPMHPFHPVHPIYHPHFVPHRVVGGTVIVGAPLYPYYGYPYYPGYAPYYDSYPDSTAYVEQQPQAVEPMFYCPDYRNYYPAVQSCPSQWLQVVPNQGGYPQ